MRKLLWLVLLVAAAYAGYWFIGSRKVLGSVEAALTQLKSDGLANYSSVYLHGFPSRFDLTITDPRLQNSDGSVVWQAPFLQILALSYQPHNIIAVWPHDQSLTLGHEAMTLTSSDLRASAGFGLQLSLPLLHAEVEGHDLALMAPDWSLLAGKAVFAVRNGSLGANSQDVALTLTGLSPGDALRKTIDPQGTLPASTDTARLLMTAVLDGPLDRRMADRPVNVVELRDISGELAWGTISATVQGALRADANGYAAGRLDVVLRNWQAMVDMVSATGQFDSNTLATVRNVMASLEKGSGEAGVVKLPIILDEGLVLLGPIPVAYAPRISTAAGF